MIKLKSEHEIELMRTAGRIAAAAITAAAHAIAPGVTTRHLDDIVRKTIEGNGATPSFLHYCGFPASACISVNDEVIHGIPSGRALKAGDIVKLDVGANYKGFHGDTAATFPVGEVSEEAKRLIAVTRQSFYEGIKRAREGFRISDISHTVQAYAEENGMSVVRKFVGHGVGSELHESPEVPNFGEPGRGPRLLRGMTIAVEPMVNIGTYNVRVQPDGWTVLTGDGKLSAHYEHTILITGGEPEILTFRQEESRGY